jgi:hypothetical protein
MASGNTWEILHLKQAVSELNKTRVVRKRPGFLLSGARMMAVNEQFGLLAELAYALVSETGAARREGSSPSKPTRIFASAMAGACSLTIWL